MKIYILIFLMFFVSLSFSQETISVEKSTFGIQTGFLGIWFNNEMKLSNTITLRSEIGLDSGFFGGSIYNGSDLIFTPVISIEPRLYYNLEKRNSKSKVIKHNSGNFISIKSSYNPDWFIISKFDNLKIINQVSIIPTWGIRRSIGENFIFETGLGLGYRYIFAKNAGFSKDKSETALNLHLRIGYTF